MLEEIKQKTNGVQGIEEASMKNSKSGKWYKTAFVPYVYLLPAVIPLLLFYLYPIIKTAYISFMDYNLLNPDSAKFMGLANYIRVFKDPLFKKLLVNSLLFVLGSLVFQFIFGFIIALVLWKNFRGKSVYQSLIFLPWAIAGFIIAIVFRWMFNAQFGVLSDILSKIGVISRGFSILSTYETALFGPIIAMIWFGIPFFAIMIYAALQGVSVEMLEAANIDGCSGVKRLFKIVIPIIRPTILITLLLRTIWIFNSADIIYPMTNGGPINASHTFVSYMFERAYVSQDFSYVAALSVTIILLLLAFSVVYLLATKFNEAGE